MPATAHDVEIDQSGKIGDTSIPTALALSNAQQLSVYISAEAKREIVRKLRRRGRLTAKTYLEIFSAALFLLVKEHLDQLGQIVIDVEYAGHEDTIRTMLLNRIRKIALRFPATQITFRRIGKRSRAHELAIATFRKQIKPTRKLNAADILALVK